MKKIKIIVLLLLLFTTLAWALTYDEAYYLKNKIYAFSGSANDPLYKSIEELDSVTKGATAVSALLYDPTTEPTGAEGLVYYDDVAKALKLYTGAAWVSLGTTSAGTSLDGSYDLGVGITVDAGAITLTATNAANNTALAIVQQDTGATSIGMSITNAGTGPSIQIDNASTGKDIQGTSDTWDVTPAGLATFVGATIGASDLTLENGEIIDNGTDDTLLINTGDEDLLLDFTTNANLLTLSSTTGLTTIDFAALTSIIGLTTITGDAADFTLGITADAGGEDLIITQAGAVDGSIQLLSAGTGADAIDIETSAGGISIASTGGDTVIDATDKSVKLDCGEASADDGIVIVTTGAGSGMQITSLADIDITTTGASGEDIAITNTGGSVIITATEAADDAMVLDASTAGAGMQITSGADIDITTTGASGEDITITNTGGSVIIAATEAITDAIFLDASTAGAGIDITSGEDIDIATTGAAGEDISIINTGGSVIVRGTEDIADAVYVHASTGGIDILADGASAKDLDMGCTNGSTNITAGEDVEDAITIVTSTGGINITADGAAASDLDLTCTNGSVRITGGEGATDAVVIQATGTAGGIDIISLEDIDISTTGAAGEDISITNTGGSINISASEAIADAIKISATGTVASATALDIVTTDAGITVSAGGATNGDISLTAADDLILAVTGNVTGNIAGNGTNTLVGYNKVIEIEAGTAEQVLVTDSGTVFTNTAAQGATTYTLPDAAAGLIFTFVDCSNTGADDVIIDPQAGDTINGDAAGHNIGCTSDAHASITLVALDGVRWVSISEVGTWALE